MVAVPSCILKPSVNENCTYVADICARQVLSAKTMPWTPKRFYAFYYRSRRIAAINGGREKLRQLLELRAKDGNDFDITMIRTMNRTH